MEWQMSDQGTLEGRRPRKLLPQSRIRLERLKQDRLAWSVGLHVAAMRSIGIRELLGGTRRGHVVLSRQIAIYLVHVLLGRSQEEVALLFSRARATVTYACATVETLRDDPQLDAEIERIEVEFTRHSQAEAVELRHAA